MRLRRERAWRAGLWAHVYLVRQVFAENDDKNTMSEAIEKCGCGYCTTIRGLESDNAALRARVAQLEEEHGPVEFGQVLQYNTELEARVKELEEDKAILDWVEVNKVSNQLSQRMAVYFAASIRHDSFRQAIRDAMKKGTQ